MRQGAEGRRRKGRHAPIGRLQAEHAGKTGGDTDGAAAIGADRQRRQPRRQRRRAATRRSARRLAEVPWVAGDPGQRRIRHALPAIFRRGGLAQQHRARFAQSRHGGGIVIPGLLRINRFGAAQGRPAFGQQQVLDRHRHAVQRRQRRAFLPARLRCLCLDQGGGVIQQAERVDAFVQAFDPRQQRLGHLDRRKFLRGKTRRQVCYIQRRKVSHGNRLSGASAPLPAGCAVCRRRSAHKYRACPRQRKTKAGSPPRPLRAPCVRRRPGLSRS